MDATAFALCRERKLNIVVFAALLKKAPLKRVVTGENRSYVVHSNRLKGRLKQPNGIHSAFRPALYFQSVA